MTREELELMRELMRLNTDVPGFAMEFANDDLSVEAEIAFVHRLADMADALLAHANKRRGLTVDGQPTPLVIDAGYARVESESRELLPPNGDDAGDAS